MKRQEECLTIASCAYAVAGLQMAADVGWRYVLLDLECYCWTILCYTGKQQLNVGSCVRQASCRCSALVISEWCWSQRVEDHCSSRFSSKLNTMPLQRLR